jgi:TonB family protein
MIKLISVFVFLLISIIINAQNGTVKTYYSSGKVESRVSFVDEILEGTSFWYYENGNIKTERNYSNGKLNGLIRNFYEDGLIKDETHIANGILHGVFRSYYENGGLHEIKTYQEGQLINVNTLEYDSFYIASLAEYNAGKKKNNIENNDFICSVEICPEPIGGIEEIESNIIYPELARKFGLEGSVLISTTINKYGKPENIKVIQDLGLGCSEAAIEAVKKTKFIPGRENGNEISTSVTFTLNFNLYNDNKKTDAIVIEDLSKTNQVQDLNESEIEDRKIFVTCIVDECPKPIGGITELLTKLRYPAQAKRKNISGEVVVQAKVNDIGFVISADVIKSLGYGCDEAAKSVVIKTQFEPGKINGKDSDSIIEITVPFILDNIKRGN